jgi:hypothetical protein
LDSIPSRIPAEGMLTRISIRVGTFGDHPVSERVLYQVGAHLVPNSVMLPTPGPIAASTPPTTTIPTPSQTPEPPISSQASPQPPPTTPPRLPPEPARLP